MKQHIKLAHSVHQIAVMHSIQHYRTGHFQDWYFTYNAAIQVDRQLLIDDIDTYGLKQAARRLLERHARICSELSEHLGPQSEQEQAA